MPVTSSFTGDSTGEPELNTHRNDCQKGWVAGGDFDSRYEVASRLKRATSIHLASCPKDTSSTWNNYSASTCPALTLYLRPGVPKAENSLCSVVTINCTDCADTS